MSEIFAEVEEAIKREKMENFWKNYGNLVIACVLLVIFGTGGYSAYSTWRNDANIKQTDLFLNTAKADDPAKLAEVSKDLSSGLGTIAKMKAAGKFLAKEDTLSAQKLYSEIAADKNAPAEFKDLAQFMSLKISNTESSEIRLEKFQKMAVNEKNPMRFHAHVQAAIILAHDLGDYAGARKHLAAVKEEKNVPPTLAGQVKAMDILYSLKESEQKK